MADMRTPWPPGMAGAGGSGSVTSGDHCLNSAKWAADASNQARLRLAYELTPPPTDAEIAALILSNAGQDHSVLRWLHNNFHGALFFMRRGEVAFAAELLCSFEARLEAIAALYAPGSWRRDVSEPAIETAFLVDLLRCARSALAMGCRGDALVLLAAGNAAAVRFSRTHRGRACASR